MEGKEITVRTYVGNNMSDVRPAIEYKDGTIRLKEKVVIDTEIDPETGEEVDIFEWRLSDKVIQP